MIQVYNKMTENSVNKLSKHISEYVLVPLVLLEYQLYWLYSAICWVFKESQIINEQKMNNKRSRSKSTPAKSTPKKSTRPKNVNNQQCRSSLLDPSAHIQSRPTIHDERTGKTCPPVWWQKARVRLGHTAVHCDPRPDSKLKVIINDNFAENTAVSIPKVHPNDIINEHNSSKHSKKKLISKLLHCK
jgi:hypothetical protein